MKTLTVAVPAYNSETYLRNSLDSLLGYDDSLDVIIINDGSTDGTLSIANEYASRYPQLFRVVDKENGGHGSGVNTGIDLAEGEFYYVLDSDDWLDREALDRLLARIHELDAEGKCPDLLLVDTVYEYSYNGTQKLLSFKRAVPTEKMIDWSDLKRMNVEQYFTMHCMIYRTSLLRKNGVRLPEHCFYVDNILAYCPLPDVKSMYYLPVPLYRYFIGREDQSVNTNVLIKRIDQQIRVTKKMATDVKVDAADFDPDLRTYLVHYFSMMMTICSVFLVLKYQESQDEGDLRKKDDLWDWLKEENPYMYKQARKSPLNTIVCIRGKFNHGMIAATFKIARKIYKFS